MSIAADIAEAIKEELNLDPFTNFGVNFQARRNYGEFQVKLRDDMDSLVCDVLSAGYDEQDLQTRGGAGNPRGNVNLEAVTQVCLRQRLKRLQGVDTFDLAVTDRLSEATEAIMAFFIERELSTYTRATWVESTIEANPATQWLREADQYTGIVRVVYRAVR